MNTSDFCSAVKQPDLLANPSTTSSSDDEDMCDVDNQDDFIGMFLGARNMEADNCFFP